MDFFNKKRENHHHLDPLIEFETNIANQGVEKYYNLIFSNDNQHKWVKNGACQLKVLDFQTVSSEHERYQASSSMVGKTWNFIAYYWISCLSNLKDC